VLWHCWLGGRKGIRPVKNGGWWRWALVSQDGVAPSRVVGVFASVNLPLHHKVQKFFSGIGSVGWSRKQGRKTVVVVVTVVVVFLSYRYRAGIELATCELQVQRLSHMLRLSTVY